MHAVIFDFDGVLVDSEPVHEAAIRSALRSLGLPADWTDWRRYMGLGDRQAFDRILADQGVRMDEPTFDAIRDAKSREIGAMLAAGAARPYPGAAALVKQAAAVAPCAVCSGSRRHEVEPVLRALKVLDLLGAVVTADDVARTKPDPEPYLTAARALGQPPESCVAIEDTPIGVRAAVAAGVCVVGVLHTNAADALEEVGAHHCVSSIGALSPEALRAIWRRCRPAAITGA